MDQIELEQGWAIISSGAPLTEFWQAAEGHAPTSGHHLGTRT